MQYIVHSSGRTLKLSSLNPNPKFKVLRLKGLDQIQSLTSQGFVLGLTIKSKGAPTLNSKFHCKAVFSIEI